MRIGCDLKLVIAVRCDHVSLGSDKGYPVLTHQTAQAAVTDIQTAFFQFPDHPWSTVTSQAETRLSLDP